MLSTMAEAADREAQDAKAAPKRTWKRYGEAKEYHGKTYHGMKVGGVHRWSYPDGEWTERKVEPDRWDVTFTSLKRRKRRAPARSGAETGSGYHWLIVAHQWVEKLDANTYSTQMEGSKYLVAFKKPDWPVWNTQFRNAKRRARERAIAALEDALRRLREADDAVLEDPHDAKALPALAGVWTEQEKETPGPSEPDRRLQPTPARRPKRRIRARQAA